jgi:hypothetical protein
MTDLRIFTNESSCCNAASFHLLQIEIGIAIELLADRVDFDTDTDVDYHDSPV